MSSPPLRHRLRFLKPLQRWQREFCAAVPWRWLPVSSRRFGPPKGRHADTAAYLAAGGADARDRTVPIEPAGEIERPSPRAIDPRMQAHFATGLRQPLRSREVHVLHDVRYWGDYAGTIIGRDDRILCDLTRDIWEASRHRIFTRLKLPPVRRLSGVTAVLSAAEAERNYWHWTFDVLPRLGLMRRAGFPPESIDHFVVNHRDLPFQRESLEALGIPWAKVIRADTDVHLEFDCALATRSDEDQFGITPSAVEFLRSPLPERTTPGVRKLYVTRENAAFRRVLNEAAVWALLRERGFEKIDPAGHSLPEQQRLFGEASIVVGPHGAGLTNLVYARPGTRALELFAPGFVDYSYFAFTWAAGIPHWVLVDPAAPVAAEQPHAEGREDSFTVDLTALTATLDTMGS